MEIEFENLSEADLIVDCIYKGGKTPNISAEPFHKLIPGCENSGGFRKKLREDGSRKYAYIVLYTSMEELEWPDFLDEETGIFRYYGDNREPGRALTDTKKKGNLILETTFALLNEGVYLNDIPPFFIFKKTGTGRDVQFLGLAAPGNPKISPDKDLVAFFYTNIKGETAKERLSILFSNEQIKRLGKANRISLSNSYTLITAEQWMNIYYYSKIGLTDEKKKSFKMHIKNFKK